MVRANIVLSVCAGLLMASSTLAQEAPPVVREVQEALTAGSAKTLLEVAPERIEIALFGATRRYSRSQARFVLEEFFSDYPPVRVTILDGAGTESGWFSSLAYTYVRGIRPLRVYARFRHDTTGWVLLELILREES